jgi:hypothetical protein
MDQGRFREQPDAKGTGCGAADERQDGPKEFRFLQFLRPFSAK